MDEQERKPVIIRKSRSRFSSREQRAGFGLLVGTGGLSLLLGVFYIIRLLNAPFDLNYEGPRFVSSADKKQQELIKQKNTDTDGDGFSDFDELYTYRTSPYLEDSDSDGINDFDEIKQGTDPNCPEGKECSSTRVNNSDLSSFDGLINTPLLDPAQTPDVSDALTSVDVIQLRKTLIDGGAPKDQVDAMSDNELLQLYSQTIKTMEQNGQLEQLIKETKTQVETQDVQLQSDLNKATTP